MSERNFSETTAEAVVSSGDAPKSWRCRRGRHDFREVSRKSNLMARDLVARYTSVETQRCSRCGLERQLEHFYDSLYRSARRQEMEDRRLEDIIRRAIR